MQGLNENSQEHASNFTRLADMLRRELGATALALHHTGHEANGRARGSSVFGADVDTMLMLNRDNKDLCVELNMTKQKDAPEWETPKIIQLEKINLSPIVDSLVAVSPTDATATKSQVTQSQSRAKHDPRPNPMVMELLDMAVCDVLKSNPAKAWTTTDLAVAVAMRKEINMAGSSLQRRTLPDLREDSSKHANRLYDPTQKKWRWVS